MKVVVVESPAKAKTINKYLGSDFHVLASYGHIRDLPPKDGSVRPDEGFAMDWETDAKSERQIKEIVAAVKGADKLFLATDPDREGEAISWHVRQVLEARKALKGVEVKRVVFNEITKSAVLDAMRNPREIHQELVDAYLARRALDYLVGFTLSPVLWRKLPGSRSAGRVQSVALRLICERESEIESFRPREYWTIAADFLTPKGALLSAGLTHLGGKKLDKFDLSSEALARDAEKKAASARYSVASVERKRTKRNPYPPFTTSTLQQEASRKLYFAAARTMQLAQRLYEGVDIGGETVGLITYMRTDGVQMAAEAIAGARAVIAEDFGKAYVPDAPRLYKTKAKNAQEAHEAIRPTDLARRPEDVARYLDKDQLRLYELIWKRTLASQMAAAELDQVGVDIAGDQHGIVFRATGSVVVFDGFMKVYREDKDDSDDEDAEKLLPDVNEKDSMDRKAMRTEQHFTQPPPRFSEASLVKRMEELGIGRPSTYASILSVLQERNYVRLDQRRFIPEDRGRLVTAFLESFFGRYVEYNFTADLENQLDDISGGRDEWRKVLDRFWRDFSGAVDETKDLRVAQVLDALDELLGPHFFPDNGTGHDPRSCPTCNAGRLSLKLGKFGAFIGCSAYPECRFTRPLTTGGEGEEEVREGPKELGNDPASGLPVSLRKGPYGHYVQLGDESTMKAEPAPVPEKGKKAKAAKTPKPKRVSLYKGLEPADVTLDIACRLLELPRLVGTHPETGKSISAGVGRFGPYVVHDGTYKSLAKDDDVLVIGMNRAMELLSQAKGRGGSGPLKTLGEHEGKPVTLHEGRYGPYVSRDGVHATLPKDSSVDTVTLEAALVLIAAKAAKGPAKPVRGRKAAPSAKADAAPKKPAAKKAAPKKAAAKKAPAKKKPAV
ncbi:DNA topoisomerase I [Paramagnetospirillum magnetotacticum MS-1]|uniref:DNA topoisomerase 1 n=1 Tax=Paramagnetospirillum magnetotacticum MS-1 TaxID=272627 RepID=A0A0C2U6Y7_PARME|nr:type I DNA topoisomerase [Paramagnetospirillum magnetotacticum]KIL97227.1 DNA topoisomerase I [Paramagnetospirillum magnetotacticum MS-1]